MKIAIGGLMQETNTFSPVPGRYEDFAPAFGGSIVEKCRGTQTEMGGFLDTLAEAGAEVFPTMAGWAVSAGVVLRADFERLLQELLHRLADAGQVEAVLLALHGAMVVEEIGDGEGYLLREVRRLVGPQIPVVASLDLHALITAEMVEYANALVGYHAYPHTDRYETGTRAARLLLRQVRGEVGPTMAWQPIPMIVPPENAQTTHGPGAEVLRQAQRWEADGTVLAASVFLVQPWLDVPGQGSATVVVTDGDPASALYYAQGLAAQLWTRRRRFEVELWSVEEALRRARQVTGHPVVLAESSDSTSSGSPGDSAEVLRGLLELGFEEPAAVYIVDPEAVAAAVAAGVGNEVSLTVGGRLDPAHHSPLPLTGRVHLIADGHFTYKGKGFYGVPAHLGRTAVLQVGPIAVLLSEKPGLSIDPELYRAHGIEPRDLKVVAVKSPNFFRANYEPFAAEILLVNTPGVSPSNLRALPFRQVRRPLWPLDEFEWAPAEWI